METLFVWTWLFLLLWTWNCKFNHKKHVTYFLEIGSACWKSLQAAHRLNQFVRTSYNYGRFSECLNTIQGVKTKRTFLLVNRFYASGVGVFERLISYQTLRVRSHWALAIALASAGIAKNGGWLDFYPFLSWILSENMSIFYITNGSFRQSLNGTETGTGTGTVQC